MAQDKVKIRLVHSQDVEGPLIITDIDQGRTIDLLEEERQQPSYVPFYLNYFVGGEDGEELKVEENREVPGYIELVPSDKVILSKEVGVIAGLKDLEVLEVVELPLGGIQEPVITSATQDDTGLTAGDGDVVVEGDNFESFSPDETVLILDDGTTQQEFRADDAGVDFNFATGTLTVDATAHGNTVYDTGHAVVIANLLQDDQNITYTAPA